LVFLQSRYSNLIDKIVEFDRQQQTPPASIHVTQQADKLLIQLPELQTTSSKSRQIFLFGTTGEHLLSISRGENSGKRLPYHNPVEYVENLGKWDGEQGQRQVTLPDNEAIKDWLVLVQSWPVGEVVAVGRLSVKP